MQDLKASMDEWMSSDEGKKAVEETVYAQVRKDQLEKAFTAGWNACQENSAVAVGNGGEDEHES